MLDWVIKQWFTWLFALITAVISGVATKIVSKIKRDKKIEALHKEIEGLENNHQELKKSHAEVKDLLEKLINANHANQYDKLYYMHRTFMKQGWISVEDMRNVRNIYDSYHALGGNGHGTALYNDLDALPSFAPKGDNV